VDGARALADEPSVRVDSLAPFGVGRRSGAAEQVAAPGRR
jgi:hypothetical protein